MKTAEEILQTELDKEGIIYVCDEHEDYIGDQDYAFSQALSAMHEYAEQFKPKWIPITERLPEERENTYSDYVLGYSDKFRGTYFVIRYDYDSDQFLHDKGHDSQYNPITHWMQLPDAP